MKKTLIALALLGASATASADSWIYGGVQGGQSDFSGENDTAYGVHVGTGILPFIGLEAGYWDFGQVEFSAPRAGITAKADASSLYFAAKPSIDFGPLHVYARGGLHSYDIGYSSNFGSIPSDDGIDIMYGVGAEYSVLPGLTIGAGYQSFAVEVEGESDNINTFTLNATFHFL
ncbi:porin family protein [Vibrio intestinalis]|uniref:porin family protein n=1 Tax=Vibrio intestinalis TaxID=2933291 RepID=UPI0021A2FE22|nr:porin family protein [Vibrio intestinalis]